jgi:hypothetical protein
MRWCAAIAIASGNSPNVLWLPRGKRAGERLRLYAPRALKLRDTFHVQEQTAGSWWRFRAAMDGAPSGAPRRSGDDRVRLARADSLRRDRSRSVCRWVQLGQSDSTASSKGRPRHRRAESAHVSRGRRCRNETCDRCYAGADRAGWPFLGRAGARDRRQSFAEMSSTFPAAPVSTEIREGPTGFLNLTGAGVENDLAPDLPLSERRVMAATQGDRERCSAGNVEVCEPAR